MPHFILILTYLSVENYSDKPESPEAPVLVYVVYRAAATQMAIM